jgi:hypothetical protein
MSISIPGPSTAASFAASGPASNAATPQSTQQNTTNRADTVKLSASQQIRQLHAAGQTVTQIATRVRLPVEIVNSYLGISGGTS